ncbi:hypothetical protein GFC01_02390 [Desulfofundulus thermobenzoicus]|uniref:Uncharacterized protein n=2 Tax=Desulfofundulus thermobenzoicus TaxID=29376 RepID=A0A6N7INC0_9FIRM|nr:hypothetical protein [Desulfofundulus thermobenzoicus]
MFFKRKEVLFMEYFTWTASLAKTAPLTYAIVTVGTMVALGVSLGVLADVAFKAMHIDLGKYKKEYEEGGESR